MEEQNKYSTNRIGVHQITLQISLTKSRSLVGMTVQEVEDSLVLHSSAVRHSLVELAPSHLHYDQTTSVKDYLQASHAKNWHEKQRIWPSYCHLSAAQERS